MQKAVTCNTLWNLFYVYRKTHFKLYNLASFLIHLMYIMLVSVAY